MKYKLSDICDYVTDKIEVSKLNLNNYISTENMLPDKAGITIASGLPTIAQVSRYQKGDVLISNIRPYFKKIWYAVDEGGCSNDVLIFRVKEGVSSEYLYYVLADDGFFDYTMTTSKGTKMPRGDKKAIMNYEVPDFGIQIQEKIAGILKRLDRKVEMNNRINDNLLQQARCLYNHYFPYTVFDSLPDGWNLATVNEIIDIHDSKRVPLSGNERLKMENKIYPYYGAASLMDYVDDYIFDGKYLLLGEDGTVIDAKGFPILQYVWGKFWVNNHAHILTGKSGYTVESLMLLFMNTPVNSIVTGAVQQKISQANLKSIPIVLPPKDIIDLFNTKIEPLFTMFRLNIDENARLISLRDSLLPKLMNSELDVSSFRI